MATVPVLKNWTVGELVDDDMLNANLRDVADFCLDNRPFTFIRRSSNQTISTGSWTDVAWNDSPLIDSDDIHPGGSSAIFTIATPGIYDIKTQAIFAINSTTEKGRAIRIILDRGGDIVATRAGRSPTTQSDTTSTTEIEVAMQVGRYLPLVAGDEIRVQVFQETGGNLDILGSSSHMYSWVSLRWLRAA
jgi:hypothetical protein